MGSSGLSWRLNAEAIVEKARDSVEAKQDGDPFSRAVGTAFSPPQPRPSRQCPSVQGHLPCGSSAFQEKGGRPGVFLVFAVSRGAFNAGGGGQCDF